MNNSIKRSPNRWDDYSDRPYFSHDIETKYKDRLSEFLDMYGITHTQDFKALEVGSGHGIYTNILHQVFGELTAIEPNLILFNILEERFSTVQTTNTLNVNVELFNPTHKFDMIIFMHVFLFVDNKQHILNKMSKLLKSRKYIMIMEPAKFLNFGQNIKKINDRMTDTVNCIAKSRKFELIYHGYIFSGSLCYLLRKL